MTIKNARRAAPTNVLVTQGQKTVSQTVRNVALPSYPNFTRDLMGDPEALTRTLNEMKKNIEDLHKSVSGNVRAGSVIAKPTVFNAGTTTLVAHGLDRPYTGFNVIECVDGVPEFYTVAMPANASKSRFINLFSANACTATIEVY